MTAPSTLLPLFLKLDGRKVLLVGGGPVAAGKLSGLRAIGAQVTVVAPEVRDALFAPGVSVLQRCFEEADLDGVWLVIAAATPAVNRAVADAAERRRIFVNAVDDPRTASAYAGGVVRRGGVTIAISTGGMAPALAGLLREALEALLPESLERWLAEAQAVRSVQKALGVPMPERRPLLLEVLNRLYGSTSRAAGAGAR
jgi:uroporphyrin-III C-methyltransferase / precorrin-2 dehydrogenase / sirohydrochlorin ferrochelatase